MDIEDLIDKAVSILERRGKISLSALKLGLSVDDDVMGVIDCEELKDIVLIGHSYGGMVATGVADRARERVRHLIYVDAFAPRDGESVQDLAPFQGP